MGTVRILHVVTYMGRGGLETMLMNYYRHIDRSKVQFDFLVHRDFKADYDDEILSLGGKIYHLPKLNPLSFQYRRQLNAFFKNHPEYKIVHVHQDCLSAIALKAAYKNHVPVRIAHSHSSSQNINLKYILKIIYKRFIPQYATHMMACSKDAGQWMFQSSHFQVLSNAIDAKMYTFDVDKRKLQRKSLNIKENEVLIGHVGRFRFEKNHTFLIDIFDEIAKQISAKLILVGDGELQNNIKEKIETFKLQDKVMMTGSRNDVANLMQAMDVFVLPSLFEGLPLTTIEAQASGLPCLISDKVPLECKKTDLVQQIPLSLSAKEWAEIVINVLQIQRRDTYQEIKNSGFDILENAKKLQNFYLNHYVGDSDE